MQITKIAKGSTGYSVYAPAYGWLPLPLTPTATWQDVIEHLIARGMYIGEK